MAEQVQIKNQKASYRGIFKATSLFGGVQVYQILIEIIKSKFIAVLLGPTGVGIQGLYISGIQMIQQLSSFGLSQSAVRNVAEACRSNDLIKISRTVIALRRLVWLTGILGMVAVILLSSVLSNSSFGDNLHIWGFAAISVTLLFNQINASQKVILQGTHKYKHLAKCTAYGMTIGLFVSIPLYYLYGTDAIVPNIIISSITALLLSWYFSRKIQIEPVEQSLAETFRLGHSMLTMGLTMSITQFLTIVSSYVLRSFIRRWGGVDEVGLYTAGFLLMSQYTGLVFQAMATDFYPRLAAVNKDNYKCREIMNQQGEVGLLLLGPLMVICVVFIPFIIQILYSEDFLAINNYVVWCSIGVIFQMASWTISYILIAKAESKIFAINEIVVGLYGISFNLLGYYWGGLTGLGVSFLIKYILYLGQVFYIAYKKYNFTYSKSFLSIFIKELFFVVLSVLAVSIFSGFLKYFWGTIIVLLAVLYSLFILNKKMDIKSLMVLRHK